MSEERHEIVIFPNGSASIRRRDSGDTMHSMIGAWEEANLLYVGQSGLATRLHVSDPEPLVLYDVGLGIAANAIAAIECRDRVIGESGQSRARALSIVSFENDLSGIELGLSRSESFPFLEKHHGKIRELLRAGVWEESGVRWELRQGDFSSQPLNESPELIYFDFYAPKSSPSLWGEEVFSKLYSACAVRLAAGKGSLLYTYSVSTPARAAMMLAGFFVGRGRQTEAKRETTVAASVLSDLEAPLDGSWLAKLRSNPELLGRVRKSAQFQDSDQAAFRSLYSSACSTRSSPPSAG